MKHSMILRFTPVVLLGLAGCGGTWNPITPPEGLDDTVPFDISLADAGSGVVAGIDLAPPEKDLGGAAGLILQQVDGDWSRVETPDLSEDWALYAAAALEGDEAWFGGGSFVLDFSDVGLEKNNASYEAALRADLAGVTDPEELEARLAAFDEKVAIAAAVESALKIEQATGGITLFQDDTGMLGVVDNTITSPIWSISGLGPDDGWFATPAGVSQLAEGAWSSEELLAELPVVHDIAFLSHDEGWAVGADGNLEAGVAVHWFENAWTPANLPEVEGSWELFAVSLPDADNGCAVGASLDATTGQRTGVALHYEDGAWSAMELPEISESWYLEAVCFPSSNEGWAAGNDSTGKRGVLLHYARGEWSEEAISVSSSADWALTGLDLTGSRNGWAVGYDNENAKLLILKRTEQGRRLCPRERRRIFPLFPR